MKCNSISKFDQSNEISYINYLIIEITTFSIFFFLLSLWILIIKLLEKNCL